MRSKVAVISFICLAYIVASMFPSPTAAEGVDRQPHGSAIRATTGAPLARPLNINNFTSWMKANGQGNNTPTSKEGGYYPHNTSWAFYVDGFEFAGRLYLDAARTHAVASQPIRAGGQTYVAGTREGRIVGTGAAAVPANPGDAGVRVYRIRRDYVSMSDDELRRDAAETGEKALAAVTQGDMDAIRAAYALDWSDWPVADGAPYIERNGSPGYQKPPAFSGGFVTDSLIGGRYDEPGVAGLDPGVPAAQVLWTVYNDLDEVASAKLWGCRPTGLEFQCTVWGYKRFDALGEVFFKKYTIINKGGAITDTATGTKGSFTIDDLYFGQWSDPDLGSAGDDLVGCDTTLGLGFVYNGNPLDVEYTKFSIPPPSVGYDMLQGPIIRSPGSTARFARTNKPGFKNLPMTSFIYLAAGSLRYDPPSTYQGAIMWHKLMQGYLQDASLPPVLARYPSGPFPESAYPLSGDPVTGSGFVDGLGTYYSLSKGDRRFMMSSGPLTMAPGDTQEVVIGVVGGIGADRLSSVAMMRSNDVFMQQAYEAMFGASLVPELARPAHGAALLSVPVEFAWAQVTAKDSLYWFEVATDSLFTHPTVDSTLRTAAVTRSGFSIGKYWWRVRASQGSVWGSYSDARMFTITLTDVHPQAETPASFSLDQSYPNPFNPSTTIRYGLPVRSHVELIVYNSLGQQVLSLVNGEQGAGQWEVVLDGSRLASGVYYCRMMAGTFVAVRRLVMVK
jgi:hypothetical protein